MKRANETDFEVHTEGGGIEVIFKPTESAYTFYRLDPSEDGEVSPQSCRHGKYGDTDEYPSGEVYEIAFRLARQYVRREARIKG